MDFFLAHGQVTFLLMSKLVQTLHHYQQIEKAITYLLTHHQQRLGLSALAAHLGISEYYFQRLFIEWAGISPKHFLKFLTREHMKFLLDQGYSNLDTTSQTGLTCIGRSYEIFINTAAITPAQYMQMGSDLHLSFAFHDSPFGEYLLAVCSMGICHLSFVQSERRSTEAEFRQDWALASIVENLHETHPYHERLFGDYLDKNLTLLLRGTPFQIQVWQALLKIPFAHMTHYEGLAKKLDKPQASRAVASAVAKNRIAYLIPCHRVIRKIGDSGEFRWGKARKSLILAYESAIREAAQQTSGTVDGQRQ
jgi:AraC family transcriptional regulator of adaptative response/methylated-DNA-[protein]-cysteine methyltransferase